jgi:hypothetical protein
MTDAGNTEPGDPEALEDHARMSGSRGRRCQYPDCTTTLSAYNPDRLCWVHGRAVAFERLDRVFVPRQTPPLYKHRLTL